MSGSIVDKLEKWFNEIERRREIVIADNEKKLASLYQTWLEEKYYVKLADNRSDLKQKISPQTDCVIIDRYFSNKTQDTISRLKLERPETDIILLTGIEPEKDQANLDIDEYVIKPVDKNTLTEKINKINEKRSYLDV